MRSFVKLESSCERGLVWLMVDDRLIDEVQEAV